MRVFFLFFSFSFFSSFFSFFFSFFPFFLFSLLSVFIFFFFLLFSFFFSLCLFPFFLSFFSLECVIFYIGFCRVRLIRWDPLSCALCRLKPGVCTAVQRGRPAEIQSPSCRKIRSPRVWTSASMRMNFKRRLLQKEQFPHTTVVNTN